MNELVQGFLEAIRLILTLDPELMHIVALSLQVTGAALLVSAVLGIPLGCWLGLHRFIGRRLVIAFLYTGMGLPPVVVGLLVYLLLSHSGPLGALNWLFTPKAMFIAQVIISFPLVAGFTMAAVMGVDPNLRQQVLSLGATTRQATLAVIAEARLGILVSIVAGFGSIISEVGAVMLVGGNIQGATRVLTTAIVLQTRRGNFDQAIALGLVLLGIAFVTNLAMLKLQGGALEA